MAYTELLIKYIAFVANFHIILKRDGSVVDKVGEMRKEII